MNQILFTNQDAVMIRAMDAPPERLYRPDLSIIAWRKMCDQARGLKVQVPREDAGPMLETDLKAITKDYTSEI
jgi:hypothetical protein